MKDQILKIAKVKSEKEFYKKYPTEEAFMAKHGKALQKAAMGKSMVNKQLHQLTEWDNPKMAQRGVTAPLSFQDLLASARATNAGITKEEQLRKDSLQEINNMPSKQDDSLGIGNMMGTALTELIKGKGDGLKAPSAVTSTAGELGSGKDTKLGGLLGWENGGELHQMQFGGGLTGIGNTLGSVFGKSGGVGSGLADLFGGEGTAQGIIKGGRDIFSGGFKSGVQQLGTSTGLKAAGKAAGIGLLNAAPQILGGIDQIQQQKKNIDKANQASQISGLTAQVANIRPEKKQRQYVRPEDSLVQPGQLGSPTGTGTSYLQYGGEIQNTYAPNNLYTDLGYEPLEESVYKQYRHGGHIQSAEFGDYFQDSGQASIGSGIGTALGSVFGGPIGGAIGGFIGKGLGNVFGGSADADRLKGYQEKTKKNTEAAAWATGAKNLQAQNAAFMEYGGEMDKEHAWVSNGWQPQVIAKFGDYSVKDLLKPPHDADMLRAGGHLREYTPPSAQAMFTGKPELKPLTMNTGGRLPSTNMMFDTDKYPRAEDGVQFAMGGDLKVGDGGYLETLAHNPNLPGGEIGMFRGQSHDNGGIQTKYGDNHVEVEGGEPAVKLQDGGSSDNLVVFGNMKINKNIADLMGDPKAKDMKFKTYVADIAKNDKKQGKRINKALELINDAPGNSAYDNLTLNTGHAMLQGAKAWQKINADRIKEAGIVQDAIHQTAKQLGVKSDKLAEGKIEKETDPSMVAQLGQNIVKDALGKNYNFDVDAPFSIMDYSGFPTIDSQAAPTFSPIGGPSVPQSVDFTDKRPKSYAFDNFVPSAGMSTEGNAKEKGKIDWKTAAMTALSYAPAFLRPSNANEPLNPDQIYPEMFALATNQLEPVQAQTYRPMLDTPYDISLQDQINAVDSQARAAIRAAGSNPSAQAAIMAQALEAKNKVLGEQTRINQVNKAQTYAKNRDMLNDAQMKNLQILDNQYIRQAEAKSKTKEQAIAALSSIAAKTAQQRAANRKLAVMENMYNFRFSPSGVAYNVNQPAQFDEMGTPFAKTQNTSGTMQVGNKTLVPIDYDDKTGEPIKWKTIGKDGAKVKARNSSIVKALKNL